MTRRGFIVLGVCASFVALQFFTCERTNPKVTGEIAVPDDVHAILKRACYDCHSNETSWPWYSRVAPVSWLLHRDVSEGRQHLNFSEWATLPADKRKKKQANVGKLVVKGKMPLWFYLPLHPDAHVSDADKAALDAWSKGPPARAAGEPASSP
jgi:Haem-binding domain